jgi:hypothetical protein
MDLNIRQCQFTEAFGRLIVYAVEQGLTVKMREFDRTVEQQREFIKQGLSKTMDSRHLDGLAGHLYIMKDGKMADKEAYRFLGERWEALGGRWGGRFGLEDKPREVQDKEVGWDPAHFEFRKA